MSTGGLSSGDAVLVNAAKSYFAKTFQNPTIQLGEAIDKTVSWSPAMKMRVHDHLTVIAEVSEKPYPLILSMRRSAIIQLDMPISVYSVCPEESYLANQAEFKRLTADGFGLITVDANGNAQPRSRAIPLIQQITEVEFAADIKGLPVKLRKRLAESFDHYNHSPPTGAADVAEVMEGLVLKAGREAAAKNWIPASEAKPGASQKTLIAMQGSVQCKNAAAALGAAQGFISMYRNLNHHFPKDRKQAAKKYRDSRHGFLEGLKKVGFFRDQMRNIGLSGGF
ncbi:hypothetical protein [Methylobacterium brachiatum]|uniref:hypothetical protein n=1 Tax=Methylobacterium brachiatum TaxID=269660 RepID=UPI0008F31B90|nr:hypothetical protein [Methylobacterium brachiatum]SFI18269.1 hypothetical protein SAMN02799642_01063 [Methylobacterium brachiatum]